MKKILITTALASAMVVSAFGQGTLAFSAGAGKIKFTTDGVTLTSVAAASPATAGTGELNITAFSAAQGTVLTLANGEPLFTSAWSQSGTLLHNISPVAGAVAGSTITMSANSGAQGAIEEIEIVGWAGTATSWTQALADGDLTGFTGSTLSGGALGYQVTTGNTSVPGTDVTGAPGFNGLVLSSVPEPTTMALGGLGAAAMLLFRRRK